MTSRKFAAPAFVLAFVTLTGACISRSVDPAYEALTAEREKLPEAGTLGAGDRIKIRVFGEETLTGEFTVSEKGKINYPHIGRLDVSGKTCAEVERQLSRGLKDGYLKNPDVSCSIVEYNSKRIYVLGEVQKPGSFPYRANLTIVEAFSLAQGATETADTNNTKLTREVDGKEVQVRVPMQAIVEGRRKNIELAPGDVIYVPESAF
ncbi:MAG: polysaccharide biosynthesis/export family protein [Bradymonadaceae bacterium]